ncbi:unnamed protein product, partial [Iphiclides podalirius]
MGTVSAKGQVISGKSGCAGASDPAIASGRGATRGSAGAEGAVKAAGARGSAPQYVPGHRRERLLENRDRSVSVCGTVSRRRQVVDRASMSAQPPPHRATLFP